MVIAVAFYHNQLICYGVIIIIFVFSLSSVTFAACTPKGRFACPYRIYNNNNNWLERVLLVADTSDTTVLKSSHAKRQLRYHTNVIINADNILRVCPQCLPPFPPIPPISTPSHPFQILPSLSTPSELVLLSQRSRIANEANWFKSYNTL